MQVCIDINNLLANPFPILQKIACINLELIELDRDKTTPVSFSGAGRQQMLMRNGMLQDIRI